MKKIVGSVKAFNEDQNGAALVTVLLISLLLLTASAAMLSAVGASSKNNSDSLSESKAYWAAESGLQASINALRNNGVTYDKAVQYPTLAYDAVNLPGGLAYTGADVIVNSEARYRISVSNPDANSPYTFSTTGSFRPPATGGAVADSSVPDTPKICVPTCIANPRTEVRFSGVGNTSANFITIPNPNPPLGVFSVEKVNGGVSIPTGITFRIEFALSSPSEANRTIRGTISASSSSSPVELRFLTQSYTLQGSTIELCSTSPSPGAGSEGECPNSVFASWLFNSGESRTLYADLSPTQPYRLLVRSTGFATNGSRKQLEAILQRNFFNDLASTSAISMIGPATGMVFDAGTGGPRYCGVDGGYLPGGQVPNTPPCTINPNTPTGPSIGVTDPNGLPTVIAGGSGATLIPAPDLLTDLPVWQQSPQEMDQFVSRLRTEAQNTGRYIPDGNGTTSISQNQLGSHSTGTGLSFCEGDCSVGPLSAGGILVVTGRFEYNGNFSFNGLILVTGAGGMHRAGGGGGQIIGNVVIAPYNPGNLNAGFLPPSFTTNGGGNADILFGGISSAFDGTSAITNFMVGIAEK